VARINRWGLFFCALLIFSGALKGEHSLVSRLPVDLTLLSASGTLIFMALKWLVSPRIQYPYALAGVAWLFLTFVPGCFLGPGGEYPASKVAQLFTLTPATVIAPILFMDSEVEFEILFRSLALVALGVVVSFALGGKLLEIILSPDAYDRAEAFGGGPILFGRAMGYLTVFSGMTILRRTGTARLRAGMAFLFFLGLGGTILSGSRGPLLAAILPLMVLAAVQGGGHFRKQRTWAVVIVVGMAMFIAVTISMLPQAALDRIVSGMAPGAPDASTLARQQAYGRSLDLIGITPLGIGWGGFTSHVNAFNGLAIQYPHNLFVEVFLEGGWMAGFSLVALMGAAPLVLWRHRRTEAGGMLLAALLYFLVNAMVSSDVNGNRPALALAAAALTFSAMKRKEGSPRPIHAATGS
jgi:hypothetical protein